MMSDLGGGRGNGLYELFMPLLFRSGGASEILNDRRL